MKQNEFKTKFKCFRFCVAAIVITIKRKFNPEKIVYLPKNQIMKLYSEIRNELDRKEIILNEIDCLKDRITDESCNCLPELRDFDFDRFKARINGIFYCLDRHSQALRRDVFADNDSEKVPVYEFLLQALERYESELNLRIEMMRILKNLSETPSNQVSKQEKKQYLAQVKCIFK